MVWGRLLGFVMAFFAAASIALALGPLLRRRRKIAYPVLFAGVAAVLGCPLLVPPWAMGLRFLAAILSVLVAAKMMDYCTYRPRPASREPRYRDYARFLADPFVLIFREDRRSPPPALSRAREGVRIVLALLLILLGAGLLYILIRSGFGRSSFLADHVAKVLAFGIIIEAFSHLFHAAGRLFGRDAPPVIDWAFLSRTPAEFWRRYNRLVGSWLHRHVFLTAGGRRKPFRAVLLTFLVSGILHEYIFDVASTEFHGYQLVFFLLQGVGVCASSPLDRWVRSLGILGQTLARMATGAFVLLSSVFFFASFDRIMPGFYSAERWLP
jgi:hypothetical protein